MRRLLIITLVLATLGTLVLSTGCEATKISDIKNNTGEYEGKEVRVSGTVTEAFWLSLLTTGAYQVDDGSGSIWVVTHQPTPDKDSKVTVKGTVNSAVKIGDRSLGTVINEISRK